MIAVEGGAPSELLSLMYIVIAILFSVAVVVIIVLVWCYRRRAKAAAAGDSSVMFARSSDNKVSYGSQIARQQALSTLHKLSSHLVV